MLWNDLGRTVDRVGNGYILYVLGILNGWIGDNGRRVVEFSTEKGLCVGKTYFEHKSLSKYTRVARG